VRRSAVDSLLPGEPALIKSGRVVRTRRPGCKTFDARDGAAGGAPPQRGPATLTLPPIYARSFELLSRRQRS